MIPASEERSTEVQYQSYIVQTGIAVATIVDSGSATIDDIEILLGKDYLLLPCEEACTYTSNSIFYIHSAYSPYVNEIFNLSH